MLPWSSEHNEQRPHQIPEQSYEKRWHPEAPRGGKIVIYSPLDGVNHTQPFPVLHYFVRLCANSFSWYVLFFLVMTISFLFRNIIIIYVWLCLCGCYSEQSKTNVIIVRIKHDLPDLRMCSNLCRFDWNVNQYHVVPPFYFYPEFIATLVFCVSFVLIHSGLL